MPTQDYLDKELDLERKPAELFKIWNNAEDTYYYYTSADIAITYNGHEYTPASLERGRIKKDDTLQVTNMEIKVGYAYQTLLDYLSQVPSELIWMEIMKVHREQSPIEAHTIFIGQIQKVSYKGVQAIVTVVGFEYFLKMKIPKFRYQKSCNHDLFDTGCTLNAADYKVTAVLSAVSSDGLELTCSEFDQSSGASSGEFWEDGYFTHGWIEFGNYKATIRDHIGAIIHLKHAVPNLQASDTVYAYPGCDGAIDTCLNKFDNLNFFLGFPYIQDENPATWS